MSACLARVAVLCLVLAVLSPLVMLAGCGRDDLGALLVRWPF